jgi:hypothetical protein
MRLGRDGDLPVLEAEDLAAGLLQQRLEIIVLEGRPLDDLFLAGRPISGLA